VVLVNEASRVHFTYRRYLENRLREEFDLGGTAVVLHFRSKAGARQRRRRRSGPTHGGTRQEIQRQQAALRYEKPKPGRKAAGGSDPVLASRAGENGTGRAGKGKPPTG